MVVFNYQYQQYGNIQIHTTGCGLCIFDALQFAKTLPQNEKAIVFNTCSFIKEREIENHLILNLLKEAFNDHQFYILGCDIDNNKDKYIHYGHLVSNNELRLLKNKIDEKIIKKDNNKPFSIKIQDGCNYNCSYCIIHKLRNQPYSTPYKQILDMIADKESIELCGTELCLYFDKEYKLKFSSMLNKLIYDCQNLKYIEMSSLDPASNEIENIIDVITSNSNIFIPHITLAVQSGCDEILKYMKRRHTVKRIREIHQYAKQKNVSIGWEIIVGFPGETDEQFKDTLNLMKELKPIQNTIFTYSPREKTEAYYMPNQIDEVTKSLRKSLLDNLDKQPNYTIDNDYNSIIKKLLNNESLEYNLDMFNNEQMIQCIKNGLKNYIIKVSYNNDKPLESQIYINFIKEFFKDIPILVEMEKNDIDIKSFEQQFKCKVINK